MSCNAINPNGCEHEYQHGAGVSCDRFTVAAAWLLVLGFCVLSWVLFGVLVRWCWRALTN
jgi:hypothetical protein